MNDGELAPASSAPAGPSAGRLLREAREKRGMHIAALAASIKVTPKKLEALESDRFDLLPDATFARALAQTVCRALKIDSGPVMALLPPPADHRLEQVGGGLNARFRDRRGIVTAAGPELPGSMTFWATAVILVAALVVWMLPAGVLHVPTFGSGESPPTLGPASDTVVASVAAPVAPAAPLASVPSAEPASDTAAAAAPTRSPGELSTTPLPAEPARRAASGTGSSGSTGLVQLQTTAPSWIEVVDSRGQVLLSRLLQPGEEVGLDGAAPIRFKVGNVEGTRLLYRGQPVDLEGRSRDNVARFELK